MPSSTIAQTIIATNLVTANLMAIIAAQWSLVVNHCSALVPKDIDYVVYHFCVDNFCSASFGNRSSVKAEMHVIDDNVQAIKPKGTLLTCRH